jgi:hypothetical protein
MGDVDILDISCWQREAYQRTHDKLAQEQQGEAFIPDAKEDNNA